ncbi:uncharacterized protein LOC114304489 [Camellia sinensis]|uniref:uncharacterized protein LOC114304489 n=1 Tax=Camellia sinensis TaxID=4442 RepID=UPI0010356F88|nr:uncharacterized protein LOC114304489 [Camellia sinensis]
MEILARILAEKSKHPLFKFHWRCEKTKIVNLCFADDLMIFSKGDIPTVQMIMHGLDEFKNLSGLTPSASKSNIFFCGCSRSLREDILKIANFNEGTLPVKYLGVPLITTKLRTIDCQQLIDKITSRIKSWTNKALSYAGRAQLIETILFSMQVYWSSLFILPKKVVIEIENLLRAFLWSGIDLKKHSAKIAWDKVCAPKEEGGLGFKSLEKVSVPSDSSWVWRKILSLRKAIFPLILHKIGNGNATFLWHDNWHPVGSIWDKFEDRIIYDSGLQGRLKSSSNDIPIWTLTHDGKFSIQSAWNHWRVKHDKVAWYKLLWGPLTIPRVSFIVWIALHGRLNTGDRLESFGMSDDFKCSFCNHHTESHSHLFFNCIFSLKVWDAIKAKCNVKWPDIFWPDIVHVAIRESRGKSLKAITTRLSLLCIVYQIWIERNNRIFNKEMKPEEVVIKTIVQMIRGRLMSLYNLPRSAGDDWFLKQWNLTDSILKPRTLVVSVTLEIEG